MVCATLKEATADEAPFFKVAVAGGRSQIKFVGPDMEVLQTADLSREEYGLVAGDNMRGFKSLALDKAMRKLIYGTSGREIGEIDFQTGTDMYRMTNIIVLLVYFLRALMILVGQL